MTDYLHHVPGRLRIRSKVFRCDTASRNMALRKLQALEGVSRVRLNQKAGSVTISYDTDVTGAEDIVGFLDNCECMKPANAVAATRRAQRTTAKKSSKAKEWDITREVGKIAFNVLVSRGVSYSLTSVLGIRA